MLVVILSLIQIFLLYKLLGILQVIFIKYSSSSEIEFPFTRGDYLITDGLNSKTNR